MSTSYETINLNLKNFMQIHGSVRNGKIFIIPTFAGGLLEEAKQ